MHDQDQKSRVTALVVWAAWLVGCGRLPLESLPAASNQEPAARPITQVATVEVLAQDLAQKIEMPGSVEGYESVDLYAKVGGYLEWIKVDIGDEVDEGQVLAKLHVPEMVKELHQKQSMVAQSQAKAEQARAAVNQAEADIVAAEAAATQTKAALKEKQSMRDLRESELARWTELLKTSPSIERRKIDEARQMFEAAEAAVVSHEASIRTAEANVSAVRAKYDKARADEKASAAEIAVAKASYDQFATMLSYAEIKAPFAGVVTQRFVHAGSFIQPAVNNSAAKPLVSLAHVDRVRISLDIPMGEVRFIDLSDRVVFDRITVLPGVSIEGKLARFSRSLDPTSRMMRAEIDLDNPAGADGKRRLLPGYFGYITIYLTELKAASVVPASAIITRDNKSFAYVVESGRVHPREVTVAYQDGTIVGITSELKPGEVVVAAGANQLRDGQEVVVRPTARAMGG